RGPLDRQRRRPPPPRRLGDQRRVRRRLGRPARPFPRRLLALEILLRRHAGAAHHADRRRDVDGLGRARRHRRGDLDHRAAPPAGERRHRLRPPDAGDLRPDPGRPLPADPGGDVLAADRPDRPAGGRPVAVARALLAEIGLSAHAARPAGTLDYGAQRRLEIARALALKPRYLLLDEPAAGMNPTESSALLADLARLREHHGIGLIVIDHDLAL